MTVTELTARAEDATRKQTTTAKVRGHSVNYELFDSWQVWPYLLQIEHIPPPSPYPYASIYIQQPHTDTPLACVYSVSYTHLTLPTSVAV